MGRGVLTGKKLRAFGEGKIMKKYLISALLIVTAAAVFAAPQTYTAPPNQAPAKSAVKKTTPPPLQREEVQGVLPRGFAAGNNPLQMLNPKAPAKYGTAEQNVVLDPDTGKWKGIKLFEFCLLTMFGSFDVRFLKLSVDVDGSISDDTPGRRLLLRDVSKAGDAAHLPANHCAGARPAGRHYPKA